MGGGRLSGGRLGGVIGFAERVDEAGDEFGLGDAADFLFFVFDFDFVIGDFEDLAA